MRFSPYDRALIRKGNHGKCKELQPTGLYSPKKRPHPISNENVPRASPSYHRVENDDIILVLLRSTKKKVRALKFKGETLNSNNHMSGSEIPFWIEGRR